MNRDAPLELLLLDVVEIQVGYHQGSFLLNSKPVKLVTCSTIKNFFISVSVELSNDFLIL